MRTASTSTRVLSAADLVTGDDVFFAATGITDGELLQRGALLRRRRDHAISRDAIPLGDDPPRRCSAPAKQTRRLLVFRSTRGLISGGLNTSWQLFDVLRRQSHGRNFC